MKKIALLMIIAMTFLSSMLFAAKSPDTLLVWAVFEAPHKTPEMLATDSTHPAIKLLQADGHTRSMAIIFPMMDLTDMNAVSIQDISTFSLTPLQNAAKRYKSNRFLMMRITQTDQGYEVHALLSLKENPMQWNFQDPTLEGVLKLLIEQVADAMNEPVATAVAAVPASQPAITKIHMKIIHIMSQDDFLAVQDYLQHLAGVTDVDTEAMSDAEVVLTLTMRGDQQALVSAITEAKKLLPVGTDTGRLIYQWNP